MPIDQLHINGFKCFDSIELKLNNITILTGSNGTGKSSVIQAILLARIALEKNAQAVETHDLVGQNWKKMPVPLNTLFELQLGTVYDIFNSSQETDRILIRLNNDSFVFLFPGDYETEDDAVYVSHPEGKIGDPLSFLRKREFYYLNTERLGPRLGLDGHYTDFVHCGWRGELSAQVLFKFGITHKVNDQRQHPLVKSQNLQQQVDGWLSDICIGTQGIVSKQTGSNRYQIMMRSAGANQDILAPNIGFGISYSLPIIIQGLIAKPGCVFIVENPEAHLHPKGQSNIGYFLGLIAAAGVKVIIETHSEHIVNGVRRASLSGKGLSANGLGIYFFSIGTEGRNHQEISQTESGDLKLFPKDFFDQVNQDMAALHRLKTAK